MVKGKEDREKLMKLLENIQSNVNKLYHVATHDEKTGLHNHVFFKEVMEFELEKARRGKLLSLIILDIDHFKNVNDAHGHIKADKMLKRLAVVLEDSVRTYDIAARFGGEEFFVLLPNTGVKKARVIGERLRKKVMNDKVLGKYKITISIGVSEYKQRDNFDRISDRADKALYEAKKGGRNRVCVAE